MVAAIGVALALAVPGFAAHAAATVPERGQLQDMTVADMTGDGIPDLVVTRLYPDHVERDPFSILAGDGKGGFSDVTAQLFDGPAPGQILPRHTVVADFNGDGRNDIYFADTGWDAQPFSGTTQTLVLSTPAGKLVDASANLPQDDSYTHTAAAADVNHDGAIDIYQGNICCAAAPPRILLNDGHGRFTVLAGALPDDMLEHTTVKYTRSAFADVNGDGSPDLVLAGEGETPDAVLLNDGTGHFHRLAGAMPPKPYGGNAEGLVVKPVELNGDGKVDLLMGYTAEVPFYVGRWIEVLINNGDGTFRNETASRLPPQGQGSWPYGIDVGDLNHDGHLDFVVQAFPAQTDFSDFYLGRGDGTFALTPIIPAPGPVCAFVDANRDGLLDIVSVEDKQLEQHYTVFQQKAPAAKPKPKPKPKPKKKPHRHHP